MIAFLTLLLGLVVGPQAIEVAAPEGTAWVELRLDGEPVMLAEGPPFRATVDFGAELAPHRLEAVAFAADGSELARTAQTVNLEPTPARVSLLLERDRGEDGDDGRPVAARVLWAAGGEAPESVTVTLDGEPLPVAADGRAALPERLDLGRPHHLHAEATFAGTALSAGAVFGGVYGSEAAAELTAVPLETRGRRLRRPQQVGGWLRAGGEAARVAAVDSGAADLVMVVDRSAWPELHAFGPPLLLLKRRAEAAPPPPTGDGNSASTAFRHTTPGLRRIEDLRGGDRLFFVVPERQSSALSSSSPERAAQRAELFQRTVASGVDNGPLPYQLAGARLPDRGGPQALADALAVAGRWAAASGRPRAVALIVGPAAEDASRIPYAEARAYLERLRVPLFVWYVDSDAGDLHPSELRREGLDWRGQQQQGASAVTEGAAADRGERRRRAESWWGPFDADVETLSELIAAGSALRGALEGQRVVWVEGAWLPSEVELVAPPRGVSFAGGDG